ncbi:helicase DnaB [Mycolicibacterium porcinum]|uniref:Helicase DnaB n=1 Tax=Mycolicibacterium porcinum TaxID=39693 RepID=A0ABV3VRE4_9MYCO
MTTAISNTIAPEEVPFMWEPEDQLIGALLHMSGQAASEILVMVPTDAIQHPVARWAYELITTLVLGQRGEPDPTLVLTLARSQPPAIDANTAAHLTTTALRPNVLGDLGNYLANAYTHAHSVSQVREYARLVLDDAFRRTAGIWGARLQALADSYADREEITAAITDIMRGELRDLWQRAERAAKPTDDSEGK